MMEWQPIETAPKGEEVILYQPESGARYKLAPRIIIDYAPTSPRQSTHWMPLPNPPEHNENKT